MKNRVYKILKFLIGWPLSILALAFIVKLVAPKAPALFANLNHISLPLLSFGVLSFLLYFFLRGYIWKRMIKQTGHNITYRESNYIWATSELKRYIPGNIWSFLGRAVMLHEKGMSKQDIASCTFIEIELIILGGSVVCLLAFPFLTQYLGLPNYLGLPAILLVGILMILYIFHSYFKIKHLILPAYPPAEISLLLLLNLIMFFAFGLGHYFTFASFMAIDPNLVWQLSGISVLAYLAGYLSVITPSGFGVREGALIFALVKIMSATSAGFLSLFSRLILILAELIFVGLSYLWFHTKNKFIVKLEHWIPKYNHEIILAFFIAVYVLYFSTITFLRFDNYYAGRFDLGNMAQTVWNTTQGRIFMLTDSNGTAIVSRLSVHADFILVLLAPFYALWSNPKVLLLIQTLVVGLGAVFVYLLGEKIVKNKNLSLTFAFLYLINPAITRTNIYDFHAVTLATTFLLGAYYFFMQKRYWYFLLFATLAGICKEQIWAIIGLFGILLFFQHKKRILGIVVFISGILLSYLLIAKAIPQALGAEHFALTYLSDFGDKPFDIIKNILLSPQHTLSVLFQPDRIDYLIQLFSPLGFLSLLAPLILFLASPEFLISLLSNNQQLHQIYYQYSATVSPFLFIAALYGTNVIKQLIEKTKNTRFIQSANFLLVIYLLVCGFYGAYLIGPLPGAANPDTNMITKPFQDKNFVENYIAGIDKNLAVAASNNIGSHFSNREKIYVLPLGIEKADILVFLLTDSEFPDSLAQQKTLVEKLKSNPEFQLAVERNEFVVFKRVKITTLHFTL